MSDESNYAGGDDGLMDEFDLVGKKAEEIGKRSLPVVGRYHAWVKSVAASTQNNKKVIKIVFNLLAGPKGLHHPPLLYTEMLWEDDKDRKALFALRFGMISTTHAGQVVQKSWKCIEQRHMVIALVHTEPKPGQEQYARIAKDGIWAFDHPAVLGTCNFNVEALSMEGLVPPPGSLIAMPPGSAPTIPAGAPAAPVGNFPKI